MSKRKLIIDRVTGEVLNAVLAADGWHPGGDVDVVDDIWGAGPGDRIVGGRLERPSRPVPAPPPPEMEAARQALAEAEQAWQDGDIARMRRALERLKLSGVITDGDTTSVV
jgi:hypothetical protein